MAQIKIENLSFKYPNEEQCALGNVSTKIEQGQFVLIVGKTGCGKSTLLRNLKPILRPHGDFEGQILFDGQNINEMNDRKQAEKIGFVMQSVEHQLVTDEVCHELAFGLENLGYPDDVIRVKIAEIAEYFGITDWYEEKVDTLSGGQKQILNLAAQVVMNPEVLILDEPTAGLDPIAAERFLEALRKIHEQLGVTIILSEHRLNDAFPMADKIILMNEGAIVYDGSPKDLLKEAVDFETMKLLPDTVNLYFAVANQKKGEVPISIREGRAWIDSLGIEGKTWIDSLEAEGKPNSQNEEENANDTENILCCKNIFFRYAKDGKDILKKLSFEVRKGEIFALLGGNGTGKTTLMTLLTGIKKPYRGKIRVQGTTAYLPQDVQTLFSYDKVEKELKGVPEELVENLQLKHLKNRHPYDLSGGEQQKLGLAKVLKANPNILLLDEPTTGIDGIYKEQLGELLKRLKEQGKTIILVSHDIDFCGEYADTCGLLTRGEIVRRKQAREFFETSTFYTTTIHKIAGHKIKGAVKKEELICFLKNADITS